MVHTNILYTIYGVCLKKKKKKLYCTFEKEKKSNLEILNK